MEDYINVLLKTLEERDREYLGWEYYMQSERAMEAMETLEEALSPDQRKLFRDYENKQTAADDTREKALTRQIFLLAREIYR